MTIPLWVNNLLLILILFVGTLCVFALLIWIAYMLIQVIMESIFKLSSNRLIAKEFRRYYLRGIQDGSIEITPVMKKIIKITSWRY